MSNKYYYVICEEIKQVDINDKTKMLLDQQVNAARCFTWTLIQI